MKTAIISLVIVGVWWGTAEIGWLHPRYLPNPIDIIYSYRSALGEGVVYTVLRTIIGYTIGLCVAYLLHSTAIQTRLIDNLDIQFAASRAIPTVALMPLFVLWFGFAEYGRITVITLTALVFFLAPLHGAYSTLPREWTIIGDKVRMSFIQYYTNIIIPGTLDSLQGAFRVTLAICFTIAIATDYMGSEVGIGKFLDIARATYNIPGIFLAIIISALLGLSLDRIVVFMFRRYIHWAGKTAKA